MMTSSKTEITSRATMSVQLVCDHMPSRMPAENAE